MSIATWEFESPPLHLLAEIAQLVEHNLAKVGVASSSLVFRSILCLQFSHCLRRARFSIKSHGPIAQLVRATGS